MKKDTVLLSFVLFLFSTFVSAKDIYVSKLGKNENDGSQNAPLGSLEMARDLIRQYKQTNKYLNEPFIVWIDEGVYELTETFELSDLDSGTAECPIIWRAMPGKTVRISGGKQLPSLKFGEIKDSRILHRLTKEAKKHVRQIDLLDFGIKNFGNETQYGHALPVTQASLELIVNDSIMTLARYPNKGYIKIGEIVDKGSVPRVGDYSQRGGVFKYVDERHERWIGQNDIWFQGTFNTGYADDNLHVDSIDKKQGIVKLSFPHMYGLGAGKEFQHYFVKNVLDELDSPGEYYVDKKEGILYFWNPYGWDTANKITITLLENPIVTLKNVNNIILQDLIIESGRGIGIYMEQANNNKILGCIVRNVGTSGIFMGLGAKQTVPYITHDDYEGVPVSGKIGSVQAHIYKYTSWNRQAGAFNLIKSCDIYNTGTGGIYLSGGDKRSLVKGNNVIDNCKISNYNRRNKFCWAGINVDGCGNTIRHCEIFNSEWQGIYVRGNEHLFEYNEIHHVTLNSDDTSPWYIGRDPSDCGNVIRYNYFHHCGNKNRMNMGIYCDDASTDVEVFGNVFYNMNTNHGIMFSNAGRNLVFKNNIVINPVAYTVYASSCYYTWASGHVVPFYGENGLLRNRLTKDVNIYTSPYSDRYPFLGDYLDPIIEGKEWVGQRMRDNVGSHNLIVGSKVDETCKKIGAYAQFEWINNWETQNDPGFVDFEGGNFLLREDSEVFDRIKGFQPIPFDKIGLYIDGYRQNL